MSKGIKTTELYVVCAVIAVWGLRYLGFDVSPEHAQDTVAGIAEQLRGVTAEPDNFGAWIAALYVGGRSLIKLKKGDTTNAQNEKI